MACEPQEPSGRASYEAMVLLVCNPRAKCQTHLHVCRGRQAFVIFFVG